MSKVAINKCYGGFSISKECAQRIENKYGIDLSKEYDGFETLITPDYEREWVKIED